jgi:hypothetical protein
MSTVEATQALVDRANAQGKTVEQMRRAVSNPVAWQLDGDTLRMSLDSGSTWAEIGEMREIADGRYLVYRDGVALSGMKEGQDSLASAAYYAIRSLANRASTRDLGTGKSGGKTVVAALATQNKALASANESANAQNRVLMAIMTSAQPVKADVIAAGEDWLRDTVAKLPQQLQASARKLLAAALKGE